MRGVRLFFVLAGGFALVQLWADQVRIARSVAPIAGLLVGCMLMALSVSALFAGASDRWTPKHSLLWLIGGASGLAVAVSVAGGLQGIPVLASLVLCLGQVGLLMGCLGLGTFVASVVKEPNLLAPMCLFLPFFDAALVLTARGFTRQVMEAAPKVLETVAMRVPQVSEAEKAVPLAAAAFVGPADLVFVSLFAALLYRFELNAKRTLWLMAPALALFLVVVLAFGHLKIGPIELGALPALVPIGIIVLVANLGKLKLTRSEWWLTAFAGALGAALLWLGSMASG